jgi:hypothetical protein
MSKLFFGRDSQKQADGRNGRGMVFFIKQGADKSGALRVAA